MLQQVYLTVGRHGYFQYHQRLALENLSILESVYRGGELVKMFGSFNAIYSSPLDRALLTAQLQACGGRCLMEQVVTDKCLREDATKDEVELFVSGLCVEADENQARHIHLVTHLPVIEKISDVLGDEVSFVQPSGGFVISGKCWQEIFHKKGKKQNWKTFYPSFDLLAQLREDKKTWSEIRSCFAKAQLDWAQIELLWQKSAQLEQCCSSEEVCGLFK